MNEKKKKFLMHKMVNESSSYICYMMSHNFKVFFFFFVPVMRHSLAEKKNEGEKEI